MRLLAPLALALSLAAGSAVALLAAGPPLGPPALREPRFETASVSLDPEHLAEDSVGALRFLGGVALRSADRAFGGLSGLAVEPACGRLLAISDTGNWAVLRPRLAGDRLTGIDALWMTAMRGTQGVPAANKKAADAEALAWSPTASFISFEQDHRIRRYGAIDPCRPETLAEPAREEVRPGAWQDWPDNGGAEALARSPDGTLLLVIAEAGTRAPGDHEAILSQGMNGPALRFAIRPPEGLRPTDALFLDDHRIVVLNRAFSLAFGASAVLMLYDLGDLPGRARRNAATMVDVPGAVHGRELARLAPPLTVDNMEGLALERSGNRLFLWMLSDDNFNPGQRTILMRWELAPALLMRG